MSTSRWLESYDSLYVDVMNGSTVHVILYHLFNIKKKTWNKGFKKMKRLIWELQEVPLMGMSFRHQIPPPYPKSQQFGSLDFQKTSTSTIQPNQCHHIELVVKQPIFT